MPPPSAFDLDFKAFLWRHPDLSWKTVAVFCRLDRPTCNGHVYSRELWERELARFAETGIFGSIHHGPGPARDPDLTSVAFAIEHMRIDGAEVKGDIKLLDTEAGRTLRLLMEGGVGVSFSTTGIGSTDEHGVVQNDFHLTGIVALPGLPTP